MTRYTRYLSWASSSDDEVIAWFKFGWFVWLPAALIVAGIMGLILG